MGMTGLNPYRRHFASGTAYTLAARVQGPPATSEPDKPADAAKKDEAKKAEAKKPDVHVIAIADLDLISEQFFELRRRKIENLEFDNVTFVLNCIDVLAGDESFIPLRKHRLKHRTLERLEDQTRGFLEKRQEETKSAEDAAKDQLDSAQKRLDKKVEEVRARKDMDERTKEIMLMNLQEVENRRLDVEKAGIEDQKRKKILESKGDMELNVRRIQNRIRALAIVLPPLPPLILGMVVFFVRIKNENEGANPNRIA
jgi:ABC-2 type transport system permease protein